jgi:hypothetical protein
LEEKHMRIILDTDKKTITVPWNYQQKLDELNKLIEEYSDGQKDPKTFTGYIDEIWSECIKNSDRCVVTGKKPAKK